MVSNDAEMIPEKDLLVMENGQVARIVRARSSPLAVPGEYVLSDDELKLLGALMAEIDGRYPLDCEGYPRERVLLDLEFKFTLSGKLKIKQIRPYLLAATP